MTLRPSVSLSLRSRPISFTFEIPTAKLRQFWEGLENGKVYASRCRKCANLTFPPTADCSLCLSAEMEMVDVKGDGEIETFTHILIRPASFQNHPPYAVAIAKMNSGIKVLAWVIDAKPSEVRVGAKVRLMAVKSPDGPSYAFTLVG